MLLMRRRDSSLPQALYDSEDLLGRRRWRHSQVLAEIFWSAFVRQYLPSLQDRPKWWSDSRELSVGQVGLVVDPRFPRASWPVGTMTKTYPALDGRVNVFCGAHDVDIFVLSFYSGGLSVNYVN